MKTMSKYRTLFYEKLAKTDNMDEAFIKAVWVAYLDGFAESIKESTDKLTENAE
jgi:hypothetical protein